jgi:hypothetical protein
MELMEDDSEIKITKLNTEIEDLNPAPNQEIEETDIEQEKNTNKTEFIMPTSIPDMQKIKTILTENPGEIYIRIGSIQRTTSQK